MWEYMTIFFNKRTGNIKELVSDKATFDWFGEEAEDYEKIYDLVYVEYDDYIFQNYDRMKIVDGKPKIVVEEVPEKYQ